MTRGAPALLVALLLAPSLAAASPAAQTDDRRSADITIQGDHGEKVTMAGDAIVARGEVHEGDVVAVFGNATIEGTVTGDVVVVLGDLKLSGKVQGQVVSVLSHARIEEGAKIAGDLVSVGWAIDGNVTQAQVGGQIVNINFMNLMPFAGKGGGLSGLLRLLFIFRLMMLAALFLIVLLVSALVPRRLETIAAAFPAKWGWALLAGLLTYAGMFVGCLILAVTVIGIPLAVALGCAVLVTKWVGLAAILFLIGRTIGRNVFGRELPHVAAVLGGFVVYAILCLIPVFHFFFCMVVNTLAVGIAVLTRFGSEEYLARAAARSTTAGPTAPPVMTPPAQTGGASV